MPDVLLATDADWVADEVEAALGGDHQVRRVRRGVDVTGEVAAAAPALVVLDLQIGNVGGMATCMSLRLDARLPSVPVLMLLDRDDDVFLARRCEADGWLVKPLDAFSMRRAATSLLEGGRWPKDSTPAPVEPVSAAAADADDEPAAPGDAAAEPEAPAVDLSGRKGRRRRKSGDPAGVAE
jgi:DNA-binding response OmpR family regulator